MPRRSIHDLPESVWAFPPDEWLVTLRRPNGEREYRTVRGDITTARKRTKEMLRQGPYESAWIRERVRP